MIKKVISFTDKMNQMVEEIKAERGYMSFSSVIHQAIVDMHKGIFYVPAYAQPRKDSNPKNRVERKQAEKEAKQEMMREEKTETCRHLGGEIIEKVGGAKVCKYFTYYHTKKYQQEVSIDMLTEDLIKTQYEPSKERVEQLITEGKVQEAPQKK